jgi:Tfp pilus assembly protein PilN
MRPVNLIPAEERGAGAPTRTGPIAYLIVGGLVAVLAGVAFLVTTGNTIAEREAEVERLEAEEASARARADSMSAFAEFAAIEQDRTETVASLARSRFDWERVLRELALVIPGDVWLTDLTGTVSQDVALDSATPGSTRSEVAGPALDIEGCAPGHESVARFVAALRDIDGVTRVGLSTSQLPDEAQGGSSRVSESSDGCQVRSFISSFQITVAFDEVSTEAAEEAAPPAPAASGDDGGVSEAQTQAAASEAEVGAASADAEQAANYIPGG